MFAKRLTHAAIFISGAILSVLICVLDYHTGPKISFLIFFFIPVILVTWISGPRAGSGLAVASIIGWLMIDSLWRHHYRHPMLPHWNWLRAATFLTISYMLGLFKAMLDRTRRQATLDALTGLGNRRAFEAAAQREIGRAFRHREPFTVAYIDIDNFKEFNDRWGHVRGDLLLAEVGKKLVHNLRTMDVAARMGGDEFAILFPATDLQSGRAAIDKLHAQLSSEAKSRHWPVSFSVGAVTYLETPPSVEEVLRQADDRMYHVKRSGKNRWEYDVYVS